jgi:hypothetical protein
MKMIRALAIAGMVVSMWASGAWGQAQIESAVDGNRLHQECNLPGGDRVQCQAYIIGVVDTFRYLAVTGATFTFCLPQRFNGFQAVDIVKRYLQNHPEVRHGSAAELIGGSMVEAFPCPRQQPQRRR